MRIVPSYDLGALGPGEGEPTLYPWHWHYNAPGLALWIALVLAMVMPRANRTRQVLLILVPVVLMNLIWLAAVLILKPTTSDKEVLGITVLSLAVASAVLWLLGHEIARCTPYRGIVLALGTALGLALVGVFSVVDLSGQTIAFASLSGVLAPVMVLGYVLAGRMSRRAYRLPKFIFLLGIWTVAFSIVGMLLWFLLGSAMSGNWPSHVVLLLGVALVAGAIVGACIFLISLAFILLGLRSPLFRPRLFACLRLPCGPGSQGVPGAPVSSAGGNRGTGEIVVSNPGANSRRRE